MEENFNATSGREIPQREIERQKLKSAFVGKIVRKDLTKKIKEGANVPVYVLEYLLGQFCSSDDPEIIESGVQKVKALSLITISEPTRRN